MWLEIERPPATARRRHGENGDRADGQHGLPAPRHAGDDEPEGGAREDDPRGGEDERPGGPAERDTEGGASHREEDAHLRESDGESRRELGEHDDAERRRCGAQPIERSPVALVEEAERHPQQHAEEQERDAEARHVLVEGVEMAGRAGDARFLKLEETRQVEGR